MTTFEIINQIEADKKRRRVWPDYALKYEVIKFAQAIKLPFARETIEAELIELERVGKIRTGETLNDNYIKILA